MTGPQGVCLLAPGCPVVNDPLVHVWCCGELTLCGLDITVDGVELPGCASHDRCPVCRLADEYPCPRCGQ